MSSVTTIPIPFPSLHDGALLQGRLILPSFQSSRSSVRGTILAHPYAPLGGCFDDPVVSLLARRLVTEGEVVGTFNFRGAGLSNGKTSWSAEAEQQDFAAFTGIFLRCLSRIAHQDASLQHGQGKEPPTVRIILGGYSYGSMIASRSPSAAQIYQLFCNAGERSAKSELLKLADAIPLYTGISNPARGGSVEPQNIQTFYLLVSPLLPPVSTFLAMSVGSLGWKTKPIQLNVTTHHTLAVFGGKDVFASRKKLRAWAEGLSQVTENRFHFQEIEEAGHFWHEPGVKDRLADRVAAWANAVVLR